MTDRIKRMLIGFGLMFGLQLIVAWTARTWFGMVGNAYTIVGFLLIFAVAVYFGGGLVMGLLAEKVIWLELLVTALLAVMVNSLLYFISVAPDLTFVSVAFDSVSPTLSLLINFGSVILAAFVGSFIGARIQKPVDDWISRAMPLLGFLGLVMGPFMLLMASGQYQGQAGLPWYVMAIIGLSILVVVGVGYMLFTRERNDADEISISPDRRKRI